MIAEIAEVGLPDVCLEMQSPCADIEAALAIGLLGDDRLGIWRDNLDPAAFDAVTRAQDKFRGISASLERNASKVGAADQRRDLALWEGALAEFKESARPAEAARARVGALGPGRAPRRWVWQKFPQLLFGIRFRGYPALGRAYKAYARSKPEAKARQSEAHRKFRERPEEKLKRADHSRHWREHNHAKRLAQPWLQRRAEARDVHYHRPFVAIDSEGMNREGNDVVYNGVVYPDHRTFLWGAAGVERIGDPTPAMPHGEFRELPLHWLGHDDKRALTLVEILDWLTDLPEQYGDATFISFGFNYDVTMILQAVADYMPKLAYRKVFEICKKEKLGLDGRIKVKGHVYVGEYTIDWIKGKRLVIKKFRDRDNPKAGFVRRIPIYDVFGFYQSGFLKVMESLEKLKLATSEEVATIKRDKARRQNFDQVPIGEIKAYTELELRKLSLAAIKLRDGFDYMKIRLGSWSGAGAAAAALIRARDVPEHYAGWVNKRDPSPEQLIAHAAYYGGHIELLKQGYSEAGAFVYDIKSAYPAEMQDLPSMIGGRVRHWRIQENPTGLDWREVESSSKISALFIRWRLPPFYVDRASGEVRGVPFFPLPYRLKGGGILFCSEGSGWYMRDEAIAARRWLTKFAELGLPGVEADGLPCDIPPDVAKKIAPCLGVKSLPHRAKDHGLSLLITEAAFFDADESQPRPYAFIPELYEERARLRREEPGNVAEQNIKLCLNSLSGKAAQSIGGSETDPPRSACPWYAAATTAGTRRRVMEAALQNPHAIVQSSTDGVVSEEPLNLDIGERLGQWEAKRVAPGTPSVFLQSGLYTYRTEDEKLPTVKTRGMKRNYETQEEWLLQRVPVEWGKPADPNDPKTWPVLDVEQKEFVTAGSAVSGRKRFEVIGRWAKRLRRINVHVPGLKRRLNALRPELYYGTEERPARRCFELVETLPAQNSTANGYFTPSKPARPKWLDTGEIAFTNEFAAEEDEETGRIIEAM